MSTKLIAAVLLFSSAAYGQTSKKSVATATVRGNMHVDGNQVSSDATLFEGSTVETAQDTATLQMGSDSVITMATDTRSVVHDYYVKLEQGRIDTKSTCGFVVEADQIRVTPNSPNSHGVVSINGSSVSVTAQEGEFLVLDDHGRVLGDLHSGHSQSFVGGQKQPSGQATYAGTLSILDTHPILTLMAPDSNVRYELQGRNAAKIPDKVQGQFVLVNGTVDPRRSSFFVNDVISTKQESAMCVVNVFPYRWLIAGGAVAAAAGTAAAVVVTNNTPRAASR